MFHLQYCLIQLTVLIQVTNLHSGHPPSQFATPAYWTTHSEARSTPPARCTCRSWAYQAVPPSHCFCIQRKHIIQPMFIVPALCRLAYWILYTSVKP